MLGGAALLMAAMPLLGRWVPQPHALVAALGNLMVGARFATTLRPGREPLITRYTRHDMGGLPAPLVPYTRLLTELWAGFLLLAGLAHAGALAGWWSSVTVIALEVAAGLSFFLGEHVLRNRLFPQFGRATLGRTLRAIRAAGRSVHCGADPAAGPGSTVTDAR